MTELNEIINKYSTLLGVMEQLEKEAPIIEDTYKELKEIISKQKLVEDNALNEIMKQTEQSKEQANNIEGLIDKLSKQYKKFEISVKNTKKQQEEFLEVAEEKIQKLQSLFDENIMYNDIKKLFDRVSELENKVFVLEKQKNAPRKEEKKDKTEDLNVGLSVRNIFPKDAKCFSFDKIEKVTGKKPYGIVIDGNIVKVQYWTSMLDEVLPYVLEQYEGNVDKLCDSNYGTFLPQKDGKNEKFVPYFIKGIFKEYNNQTYRPIYGYDMSVWYCGAVGTIEELRVLLCEHFGIKGKNIMLYYHDK